MNTAANLATALSPLCADCREPVDFDGELCERCDERAYDRSLELFSDMEEE